MSIPDPLMIAAACTNSWHRFVRNQKGITAIEYAALAVGLTALIITLTQDGGVLKQTLEDAFKKVSEKLNGS